MISMGLHLRRLRLKKRTSINSHSHFHKEKEMADFRKWLFAFALVALMLSAGTANAQLTPGQQAFTCVANAGNPVIVRVEGITELVGDLLLQCNGGVPTNAGQQIPVSNVALTLNTNITSRLIGGGFSDALLLIDEPWPTSGFGNELVATNNGTVAAPANSPVQKVCYSSTSPATTSSCNYLAGTGIGANGNGYGSSNSPYRQPTASTVYVGRQAAVNQMTWLGVPIDAPGTTGVRIIRITNVRANACQLGLSSTLIPTQIVGFIAINGSQFITINNPQQTLAYIQRGLIVGGGTATLVQCNNLNAGGTGTNFLGGSNSGPSTFTVRVTEGFAASFKRAQYTGPTPAIGPLSGPSNTTNAVAQNVPGYAYNTESALEPDTTGQVGGSYTGFGRADAGTRILLRFNNVNTGATLVLPTFVPLVVAGSSNPGQPNPSSTGLGGWTGGFLQLIGTSSDASGNVTSFSPTGTLNFTNAPTGFTGAVPIALTAGFGTAVYEVVNADPSAVEQANIPVGVAFVSNTANNLPAIGQSTVNASFAPLSSINVASSGDPIPRFCDQSAALNTFNVTVCTCNLLFPFVTQAAGFDTGIAIANTSVDPFGTTPQTGPVTMYFYGQGAGGAAVPTALATQVTTGNVPAGQVMTYTTFGGAGAFGAGLQANPGFTGYMIATARFQYCHGFAFISDLGAQKLAEGYLAIQLDIYGGTGLNRTGIIGEVQGH